MKGLWSSFTAFFLVCCLLLPLSATGLGLCIGADGHMALEPVRNSRCATPIALTASALPQITSLPSQRDHCGPCIDVALSTSQSDDQQQLAAPHSLPKLAAPMQALVAFVLPVSPEAPQRHVFSPPLSRANILLTLCTVILLL